jgi:hypothetical protein
MVTEYVVDLLEGFGLVATIRPVRRAEPFARVRGEKSESAWGRVRANVAGGQEAADDESGTSQEHASRYQWLALMQQRPPSGTTLAIVANGASRSFPRTTFYIGRAVRGEWRTRP